MQCILVAIIFFYVFLYIAFGRKIAVLTYFFISRYTGSTDMLKSVMYTGDYGKEMRDGFAKLNFQLKY